MRFKPGQSVVCIAENPDWSYCQPRYKGWWIFKKKLKPSGPSFNEVVTVECHADSKHIRLREYRKNAEGELVQYEEWWFEPLADISEIEAILEQQPEKA